MTKPSKRPPPAYFEYASDILSNLDYRLMRLDERGLWDTMRKECWVNGFVPSNSQDLSVVLNLPVGIVELALTDRVLKFFTQKDNALVSDELESYRAKVLLQRELMSIGGAKVGQQTQRGNRQSKATLEGRVKGLNRDEMQRGEMRGKESPKSAIDLEQHKEWLEDYGEG